MLNLEQQNNTTLSPEDLLKHMQSLEKRIKSLEVTNRVILGLFIGTLAAAMTVGAGFAIAAAPIIAGSIVGGILATVALAALGVTAYKYRAEIKAGFKYAADKTVEGAKHVGEQIEKVAVRAKDSINRKTSDTALSLSAKLANAASKTNYSDELSNMTPEQKQQSQELRRMLKNLKDNPELTESVFSKMLSIVKSEKQKGFLSNLDSSGLHRVLATTSTPKEQFLLNKILFENYGEIKEVIQKLKREYKFDQSVKRNNAQDEEERKANKSSSKKPISSLFSLGGKRGSMQSNSSSMSSASTNSTDGSPVPKEVVPQVTPSGRSSPTQGEKPDYVIIGIEGDDRGLTDFGYYSGSSSGRSSPNSSGSSTPTERQSPVNLDPFGRINSSRLPAPLIPKKINLSPDNLSEARRKLKKTDSHKPEQPSTHMSEQKHTPVNQRLETLV